MEQPNNKQNVRLTGTELDVELGLTHAKAAKSFLDFFRERGIECRLIDNDNNPQPLQDRHGKNFAYVDLLFHVVFTPQLPYQLIEQDLMKVSVPGLPPGYGYFLRKSEPFVTGDRIHCFMSLVFVDTKREIRQ